jgi:hypothetical protein
LIIFFNSSEFKIIIAQLSNACLQIIPLIDVIIHFNIYHNLDFYDKFYYLLDNGASIQYENSIFFLKIFINIIFLQILY